ncbi:MAG: hypothetical protein AB7U21_02225 [Methanomethylovorans sp.]
MLTSGAHFDELLVFGIYIHEESGVKVIMPNTSINFTVGTT